MLYMNFDFVHGQKNVEEINLMVFCLHFMSNKTQNILIIKFAFTLYFLKPTKKKRICFLGYVLFSF